jgi:hypothetical protein
MCWMLGWLEWRWLGVFVALNHQNNRWGVDVVDGRTGQSDAPPDAVRCASHVTQPLGFGRFWPLELCLLVAPDSPVPRQTCTVHCSVRLWRLLWLLRALSVHCSVRRCSLQSTVVLVAIAPLGAPDSPVAHRTVQWIIAERCLRNPKVASLELYSPGAPDTIRCARPGHTLVSFAPFFLNPNLIFLLVCVEPLCTCRIYNLEQTS